MRIVAFILSIVLTSALLLGGVFLIALHLGDDPAWILVTSIAVTILVYGPLTVGSFRAYWDVRGSDSSRRYYRRVLLVVSGLDVLAAAVIVLAAAVTRAGILVPIVTVGGGAVLLAVALAVGPALYRYDRAHPRPGVEWQGIDPADIRKRVVATAVTFVGVLVLGCVGLGIVVAVSPRSLSFTGGLHLVVSLACIAAAVVCLLAANRWNRQLRDVTQRDPARLRAISRLVLRRKKVDLDDGDRAGAARYASIVSVTMSFQLTYFVLLYAGIIGNQVPLSRGDMRWLSIGVIVFLIAGLVVFVPLQVVRIRRARAYAREHASEVDAPRVPVE